ncbi:unnamed protein product [Ectocarpus sp. 8 AP-2014]
MASAMLGMVLFLCLSQQGTTWGQFRSRQTWKSSVTDSDTLQVEPYTVLDSALKLFSQVSKVARFGRCGRSNMPGDDQNNIKTRHQTSTSSAEGGLERDSLRI